MKLKTIRSILAAVLCAVGLASFAAEPISLGEVKAKGEVGGATYELPIGAKVAIYAVPSAGYFVTGTNPYVIKEVTTGTTIDVCKLPKVEMDEQAMMPAFRPGADGKYFRVEADGKTAGIVFAVTNTFDGLYYALDYKASEDDDWIEGAPTPGANVSTELSAPYLGATGLYRPRVVKNLTADSKSLYIAKVVPHYPWDTTVEIDVRANPSCPESAFADILGATVVPKAECGGTSHLYVNQTCTVAEVRADGKTLVLDMKETLAKGRGTVKLSLMIGDKPYSLPVEVAVDTTADVDGDGVPTYQITDPAQMLPVNHSWRFAEPAKRSAQAETWLSVDQGPWVAVEPFRPVNEQGLRVNDGVVRWVPKESDDYTVKLEIDCGGFTTNLTAKFDVEYPEPPEFPIVAYAGEEGYTSMEEAFMGLDDQGLEGEDRVIRVVGDVQTEAAVNLPSSSLEDGGVAVILDRGAVFDVTRQFDTPADEKPLYNELGVLVGYVWEESGGIRPEGWDAHYFPTVVEEHQVFSTANVVGMSLCSYCNVARVEKTVVALMLPTELEGCSYVVSNLTAGTEVERTGGGGEGWDEYPMPVGAKIAVYAVADEGYAVIGKNPYVVDSVEPDTVIPAGDRPRTTQELAVRCIRVQPRWPWNGLVDISFDLYGEGQAEAAVVFLTNGVKVCEVRSLTGATEFDLRNEGGLAYRASLVWDAKADLATAGLADCRLDDAQFEITVKGWAPVFVPNEDGTVKLTGIRDDDGLYPGGSLEIPEHHIQSAVTEIGAEAFKGWANVPAITLPKTLAGIGASAFEGCTGFKYVEIPSGVTNIGERAFAATQLEAVYFDGNAPTAGDNPFPAETTLYVKPSATGFGDVPGVWKGCRTVAWPNGLAVGQHFVGAIRQTGDNSVIRTGCYHNDETKIECGVSIPAGGQGIVFTGGADGENTENLMRFGLNDNGSLLPTYYAGTKTKISHPEDARKPVHLRFPIEKAENVPWTVVLTCDAFAARWTSGDSFEPDGVLENPSWPSVGRADGEGQDICIFGKSDGSEACNKCSLGWFKIYEAETLKHDFRPCKDLRDGKVGIFDLAGGKGFMAGANFEALKDPLPELDPKPDETFSDNYTELNYICSTGTQYACFVENPAAGATYRFFGGIDGIENATTGDPSRYGLGRGTESDPALIKPLLVFEGEKLIRHLLPCERKSDETKGLYDLVTRTFYASANEAAPFALRLPSRYREVEYIETRNPADYEKEARYLPSINTEYAPNSTTKVSMVFQLFNPDFPTVYGDGNAAIFGCCWNNVPFGLYRLNDEASESSGALQQGSYSMNYYFKYLKDGWQQFNKAGLTLPYGKKVEISCDATNFSWLVEGESDRHTVSLPEVGNLDGNTEKMYLFSGNYDDMQGMRLWSCRISENGVLKRNLIPCVNTEDDNLAGLYDLVEKKFHYNYNKLINDDNRHLDFARFAEGPDAVYPNASEE